MRIFHFNKININNNFLRNLKIVIKKINDFLSFKNNITIKYLILVNNNQVEKKKDILHKKKKLCTTVSDDTT